jgi:uracil-DNA glycosylase
MNHNEAKRLVNEHLRDSGLVASRASRHRDAWIVGYVEAARPDVTLDGGALVVTSDGMVLNVGSVPGDIDRVLDEHALAHRGEDPDLARDEAAELLSLLAARDPWPGVVREPVEEMRQVALRRAGHEVYPPRGLELAALSLVPYEQVRVVIVGLDPYPTPGNAIGLAFSVPRTVTSLPPALCSIHAAMRHDGYVPPEHGDLSGWVRQGVLLLNRALTFEVGTKSGTHLPIWREYTDSVIAALNDRAEPVVFALWGRKAQKVLPRIDNKRHTVITAPHPSSRGGYRTEFQQAGTFLRINKALAKPTIDWARD